MKKNSQTHCSCVDSFIWKFSLALSAHRIAFRWAWIMMHRIAHTSPQYLFIFCRIFRTPSQPQCRVDTCWILDSHRTVSIHSSFVYLFALVILNLARSFRWFVAVVCLLFVVFLFATRSIRYFTVRVHARCRNCRKLNLILSISATFNCNKIRIKCGQRPTVTMCSADDTNRSDYAREREPRAHANVFSLCRARSSEFQIPDSMQAMLPFWPR